MARSPATSTTRRPRGWWSVPSHLPGAAYSAFTYWILKLRGVPVLHQRLLTGGWPVEELPVLVRELKPGEVVLSAEAPVSDDGPEDL